MKLLYISPRGKKRDFHVDPDGDTTVDFDTISKTITNGIEQVFENVDITFVNEIVGESDFISTEELEKFDIYLCDLTTSYPPVTYIAGLVEGLGKPIIYYISSESHAPLCFSNKRLIQYSDASLENDFKNELVKLITLAKDNPLDFSIIPKEKVIKTKALISYSHHNKSYKDRLMVHLKPLVKNNMIDLWVDTKIKTGDHWQAEIQTALEEASIAILLVSADFMASDFIVDNELPPLLSKAEVTGTKIIPVILSPCRFSRDPKLKRFQSANPPNEPLSSMSDNNKEKLFDQLAHDIEQSLNVA